MMRNIQVVVSFLVVVTSLVVNAETKVKTGWNFGALPAVSFDSDLGFQYGGVVNLYDYGKGTNYPAYNHSLYVELSSYTKGSTVARFRYDSDKFFPKVRTTFDVSYIGDAMSDFYGFNGYQSVYSRALEVESNRLFYKTKRNMYRLKADFQGFLGDSKFGWVAGYTYYNFSIDSVNSSDLKVVKKGATLYEIYRDNGLFDEGTASGGQLHYLKAGLKWDSRDELACPSRGIFTEAVLQSAPGFLNKTPHTKFALIHRQYLKLTSDLIFAYRFDYQATVGRSRVPWYAQPLLITSYLNATTNQGLGGKSSLRGILRNRVVGDDVAFGNFEFRYKFLRFTLFDQNFYLATNVFFDSGIIITPIDFQYEKLSQQVKSAYFDEYKSGQFHSSCGAGLKIAWNDNFVISTDFGKSLDKRDGNAGFYIGLNYMY